jgi:glycerol uptake facilitator-like aquaporin
VCRSRRSRTRCRGGRWWPAGLGLDRVDLPRLVAGLIALILTLARTGRASLSAAAVAAWIGAAYWFTSSTSFANPAVTIARMFSDTFAGIAPASVPLFVVFQIIGAALGAALALLLYPDTATTADDVVVPHTTDGIRARSAERNTR